MSNFTKLMAQAAAGAAGEESFYDYEIENSARIDSGSYLARTPSTTGNQKTWTLSFWLKKFATNAVKSIFGAGSGTGNNGTSIIDYSSSLYFSLLDGTSAPYYYVGFNELLRDTSAWYHIVVQLDTTQATNTERQKIWVNGVRLSNYQYTAYIAQNTNGYINSSSYSHYIGYNANYSSGANGYLADMIFLDGQALDPTSFGESKNGVWVPKDLSAQSFTFGTNGFWLDFADSSNLGNDVSGNNNDFTSSGLTSSDQMIDTPTNNFATFDPNYLGYFFDSGGTLTAPITTASNGNLEVSTPNSPGDGWGMYNWLNQDIVSGMKTYVEFSNLTNSQLWITRSRNKIENPGSGTPTGRIGIYSGAVMILNGASGSGSGSAVSFNSSDTIGIAVDYDADTSYWYKNGTLFWTVTNMDFSGTTYGEVDGYWIANVASSSGTTGTARVNTGQTPFTYTPPTDYEGLSTATRSEPTIGPNSDTLSDENFNTVLWTGTSLARSITGVGFQPDFLWTKSRSAAESHRLHDAVRGGNGSVLYELNSNETSVEGTDTLVSSLDSDGFSIAAGGNTPNVSGRTYVGWNWKANGSGVSNTDGTVTSTVSVNQDAGFSIITYPYGEGTVGHGLGAIPDFLIIKERSPNANSWYVWHKGLSGTDYFLNLNNTGAESNTLGDIFYLTSTTFSSDLGLTGRTGVAYALQK
jgi:hypothetical protein